MPWPLYQMDSVHRLQSQRAVGANAAARPGRLYWPHLIWVILKLVQHFHIWWSLWERHEASWTYAAFLAQLLPPLVLYLQATTIVTPSTQDVMRVLR